MVTFEPARGLFIKRTCEHDWQFSFPELERDKSRSSRSADQHVHSVPLKKAKKGFKKGISDSGILCPSQASMSDSGILAAVKEV